MIVNINKNLPNNTEAEQSVLGSIFLDNKLIVKVNDSLSIEDFYERRHQLIFNAMQQAYESDKNIDYTSIASILSENANNKEVGGVDYLAYLSDIVPSTANIDTYVEIVLEFSIKRNLIEAASDIANKGFEIDITASDFVDYAENILSEVSKRRKSSQFLNLKEVLKEVIETTEFNINRTEEVTGLATGFSELDRMTLGFQAEELIILAARPAMGKSALALNLAINVAKRNKKGTAGIAIFSLEMSSAQLGMRMLSSEASIEQSKIRSGRLTPKEFKFLQHQENAMANLNIFFDDTPGITVNELRAKCRNLHQENKLDFVIIDYLQLLSGDSRTGNRQEEVSKISRTLKHMARELSIPVVALSQLSREVEKREDKKPIMADLRESGAIEQDADIIMFLYREEYYATANKPSDRINEADLIIAKNRHGSTGEFVLLFDREYSRFKPVQKID